MNLTIEQMREIVDGAPDWAVFWITRNEYHISMLSFPNMTGQQSYLIADIRDAIAKHDTEHCQHGYDVACLICGFGTEDGKRVWHIKTEAKKGDRVKVDFISESATIYSGKRFTGYGVLDRVEDDRVFGRLDDGTPFMCLCADVEVIAG